MKKFIKGLFGCKEEHYKTQMLLQQELCKVYEEGYVKINRNYDDLINLTNDLIDLITKEKDDQNDVKHKINKIHAEVKKMIKVTEKTATAWSNQLPIDYRVGLNKRLIVSQGLTQEDVGEVFNTHGQKLALFDKARTMLIGFADAGVITEEDQEKILDMNDELQKLEFQSQKAWHFDQDASFHNWWLDMPGCECPQMDNRDPISYRGSIVSSGCPWHGGFDTSKTEI